MNIQDIYPEVQEKSGMAARTPTQFRVPLFKTTALLFLPVFLFTACTTLYLYSSEVSRAAVAVNSIALIAAIILIALFSLIMLASARAIIVRNSSRVVLVETLYVVFVLPLGYLLTQYGRQWFGGNSLTLVLIDAVILVVATGVIVLIARPSQSRH